MPCCQIVLEFCDLGNLRDALDQGFLMIKNAPPPGRSVSRRQLLGAPPPALQQQQQADYSAVLDTAVDIACGMTHLHSMNIVHADLKVRVADQNFECTPSPCTCMD